MESKELRIGRAGQHLVMFDLLSKGFCCCQTEEGMPYDIVVDVNGLMIRLQVKTTTQPSRMNHEYRTATYLFHVRRAGRKGRREYALGEFEGFALVCMDTRSVWYYPFTETISKTLIFRVPGLQYKQQSGRRAPFMDEFTSDLFFSRFLTGQKAQVAHLEAPPADSAAPAAAGEQS